MFSFGLIDQKMKVYNHRKNRNDKINVTYIMTETKTIPYPVKKKEVECDTQRQFDEKGNSDRWRINLHFCDVRGSSRLPRPSGYSV